MAISATILAWFILVVVLSYGWALNIISLVNTSGQAGFLEVLRVIGILFAPLGIFLGYVF